MKKTMRKVLSNEEKQYIHRILDEHMEMIVNTISRNVENPSYTAKTAVGILPTAVFCFVRVELTASSI